jgi:hypothetical protein
MGIEQPVPPSNAVALVGRKEEVPYHCELSPAS